MRRRDGGDTPPEGVVVRDGTWLIPVTRGWASKDDDDAHAAGLVLNQATIAGGYKPDELPDLLAELQATAAGLGGTGFDGGDIDFWEAQAAGFPIFHGEAAIPQPVPVRLDDLRPHPRNYQTHTEEELTHLCESIRANRFYKNLVAARDGTLLAGHGAWVAAQRLGFDTLPVVRLDIDPQSTEALKIVVADNEIGRRAARDDRALSELLTEIRDGDPFGLAGTGYDEMILANLLIVTRPTSELRDLDAAAEWAGLPEFEGAPPIFRFIINFETAEIRQRFIDEVFTGGTVALHKEGSLSWSGHWPVREMARESRLEEWVQPGEEVSL